MKTKSKILLLLAVMLIATCVLTINTVQATDVPADETKTVTDTTQTATSTGTEKTKTTISSGQDILNLIPNTISLDILESEALFKDTNKLHVKYGSDVEIEKRIELVEAKIKEVCTANGVNFPYNLPPKTENGVTTRTTYDLHVEGNDDIHKIKVYISVDATTSSDTGGTSGGLVLEDSPNKEITVKYSNSDTANSTDREYIENKIKNIDFNQYLGIDMLEYISSFNTNIYYQKMKNLLNDNSIKVIVEDTTNYVRFSSRFTFLFRFFKNDVCYTYKEGNCFVFNQLTVPENVEDTDKAYCDYAVKWYSKNNTYKDEYGEECNRFALGKNVTCSKLASFNAGYEGYTASMYPKVYNNDLYSFKNKDNVSMFFILKKANTTKVLDYITINNNENVNIVGNNIAKTNSTYTEMSNKLKAKGYNNIFGAYELKLSSGTIDKDGLKIRFDLGTQNNGKEAIVLHKKHNGTYEEFTKTVKDGKIDITVNELSPFMVALKGDRKLDNEPKTRCS